MPFSTTHPALARALATQGYGEPTPVQAAILEAPEGADLLVSAQTGSGKTVAFGLAVGATLLGEEPSFGEAGPPLALVVAPTRELALQVSRELEWLYADAKARIVTCVGGMDPRREQRALSAGCHVVVGTPGRLRDHLERGNLDLSGLKAVVLDEADEMLDLGFREDLEEILDATPAERRTLLFSATIARDIATLARRYQREAVRIDTIRRDEPHRDIEYRAIRIAPNELELAVVNVLRYFDSPGALIFCATRESVRHLHSALRERGFSAVALSGELSQKERSDALQALRDGHARACVATDVAARGLDLPALDLVIHAELPQNKAALLHRSGRTGRAGRKGVSVLLVPFTRRRKAEQLLASAQIEAAWSGPPMADTIRQRDQERLLASPLLQDAPTDEDIALGRKLLDGTDPQVIAAALVRLYRQGLPEPEDLFDDGGGNAPPPRERSDRSDRPERPDRPRKYDDERPSGDTVWFRLPIGREKNADPKWLIPLICRRGHVTKPDIGQIRIFGRETKFEITLGAVAGFREALANSAENDVPIEMSGPPGERPEHRPERGPKRGPDRGAERSFKGGAKASERAASRADGGPPRGKPGPRPPHKGGKPRR